MNKAIFFDRDGVINEDTHYVHSITDFKFTPSIFEVMSHLKKLGYLFFIVTNQSGINRGYFTLQEYTLLTDYMTAEFLKRDISFVNIYMCPHTPDEHCLCRKPQPTFVQHAITTYDLMPDKCWFIGDKPSDIQCGLNAGLPNLIFINSDQKKIDAAHTAATVSDILTIITH